MEINQISMLNSFRQTHYYKSVIALNKVTVHILLG